jgi:hypothetical protein
VALKLAGHMFPEALPVCSHWLTPWVN